MSKGKRTYKKKKNHSIVPVLFTLGVIGWGFFAIDRLTSSQNANEDITQSSNYSQSRAEVKTDSWKKKLSDWISGFEEEKKQNTTPTVTSQNIPNLPVIPDKTLDIQINRQISRPNVPDNSNIPDNPDNHTNPIPIDPARVEAQTGGLYYNNPILYFYTDDSGILELKKYTVSQKLTLKQVFIGLIKGPSFTLERSDLIDSFPGKPLVLGVKIEQDILIIDLNENFGMGVSFETLKLQINQIWLTARQFSGVRSLKILINGQAKQTLGSDGFNVPELINESSWLIASGSH
ncbi:MAG: GerMN domain-containing protein [Leptospirales bacterium]